MPFGGVKQSGAGLPENSESGLEAFVESEGGLSARVGDTDAVASHVVAQMADVSEGCSR